MNTLRKYILEIIFDKDACKKINSEVYEFVLAYLGTECFQTETPLTNAVISGMLKAIDCSNPTDVNILSQITPEWCVYNAYYYLLYLQNAHEYSDSCMMESYSR